MDFLTGWDFENEPVQHQNSLCKNHLFLRKKKKKQSVFPPARE
jgi:hypothetical protein